MPVNGQITLGSGATQLSASAIYCAQLTIQNASTSDNVNVGDSTTTATTGLQLTPAGSNTASVPIQGTILSLWYAYGTAGQKVNFVYDPAP